MYGYYHYRYRPPVKKGDRKEWIPTDPELYYSLSANIPASGAATTARLAAPAGKTSGSDFVAGRIQDDENPSDAVDITVDDYSEFEWCMQAAAHIPNGRVYQFRLVLADGTIFDTYTVDPRWTIGAVGAGAPKLEAMSRIIRSW